ncbi:MAG: oligopeptide transport system substrate-binding protein [Puniceicoccaceae bacterium 5H]|nr:MAG: oligopeptide transport system substrate-binding protein [Puniceicoccaceae bacterium 5H]
MERAAKEGILLMDIGTEPKTLDPQLATGQPAHRVITALFEGLVIPHPQRDGVVLPGVADTWEHNEDASVWTFHIRENARWSDGRSVTASDFVRSYHRMLTPELGADFATMLYRLENAEAYHRGEIDDFREVGVRALDAHTLQLRLIGPTPYFLTMLNHYAWYPVPVQLIESEGGLTDRSGDWLQPGTIVSNGPFVMEEWKPNSRIRVRKNPNYWDHAAVALEGIDFMPIEDSNTAVRMFDGGELHIASTVPSAVFEQRVAQDDPHLRMGQQLGTYYYLLNVNQPPLDDVRVRQALSLAIDRGVIVEQVTRGGERPAHRFVPDGFRDYDYQGPVHFDPERARALLAEAGYPQGQGFPPLTLTYNTLEGHQRIGEAITHMWQEQLGIRVELQNMEWKTFLERKDQGDFQIGRSGWIADYYDPLTFLEIMISESGNNDSGWENADYDAWIAQAMREGDMAQRNQEMGEAESILMEDMPLIPIYFYSRRWLQDERVQGWHHKMLDNHPYQFVSLRTSD